MVIKKDISIVIPYLNGSGLIAFTLTSIVENLAPTNLEIEVIIVNGGVDTADKVALNEIIEIFSKKLNITLLEIPDHSMYEGLVNGLKISQGRIRSYINCGDGYLNNAFESAVSALRDSKADVVFSKRCVKIGGDFIFKKWFPISPTFIRLGLYGRILPFVQQEGSFWKSECWRSVNHQELKKFKLAGDYYIWLSFQRAGFRMKAEKKYLGYFLKHQNQLSENMVDYFDELGSFIPFIKLTKLVLLFRF